MRKITKKPGLVLLACALGIACTGSAGAAHAAAAPAASLAAATLVSGPATGTAARQHQIKVLTRVLQNMQRNFGQYRHVTPGPQDILDYQIGALWKQGIDGYGTTIAVIEGWNDPNIGAAVASYDKKFGLPNPQIQTIYPAGKLPAKCPPGMVKLKSYGSCRGWLGELELDVIAAHLIAPYAKILITATPADTQVTDDAASQVAPPEMMEAIEYISAHHLANTISSSDGNGEATYSHGAEEITAQDPGELAAAAAGIPVTNAAGDCGVAQSLPVAYGPCSHYPDNGTWYDSPWVTAVGGSIPNLNAAGQKIGPDPATSSTSAGYSAIYPRPAYENGVAGITHSAMRSVPDITMDGQDGESESAPLFAAVLDLATQLNHDQNLGPVNPALYGILGPGGTRDGIADVIQGNDASPPMSGFTAGRGFDMLSGWGTIDAARFVPSLVAATRALHGEAAARHQAQAQLDRLEHGIQLSGGTAVGGSLYLLDQGFLPGHPVGLSIDGKLITTLTATDSGYVTYMIDPHLLRLRPGHHVVQLSSMLVTATAGFSTG
jgi:subtilase family serine protease